MAKTITIERRYDGNYDRYYINSLWYPLVINTEFFLNHMFDKNKTNKVKITILDNNDSELFIRVIKRTGTAFGYYYFDTLNTIHNICFCIELFNQILDREFDVGDIIYYTVTPIENDNN